ncbi:MAG: hypothetical protein AAB774_01005 [Patescibacteria group bacterium]
MNSLQLALYPIAAPDTLKDAGVRNNHPAEIEVGLKKVSSVFNPQSVLESELGRIFPVREEETRIDVARRVMGKIVAELSDDELEAYLTEFQFLIDSWFDSFEKQIFEGRKLEELIKGG